MIDPYEDINGVGLLYFANYSKISDRYERHYIQDTYQLKEDWFQLAGIVSRDIHYYGNANAGEKLTYELQELREEAGKVYTTSALYRLADGELIAKIFTIKQLVHGFNLTQ